MVAHATYYNLDRPQAGANDLIALISGDLTVGCWFGSNSDRDVSDRRVPQVLVIDDGVPADMVEGVTEAARANGVKVITARLSVFHSGKDFAGAMRPIVYPPPPVRKTSELVVSGRSV
ncbi:hypothetical protein N658DRAFT_243085 [Parathielavia hyrcaniae]|uniref:Uncharacterized protein n=1 Tax=Parathielavia hyrcaniae TaxID=113614 RepID=A0AAN6Q724_9PEZI|nr:hypothetical protein N658DRAFT_243085 [Parathielavia hyrcaniae]